VHGCIVTVCNWTIGIVRNVEVFSYGGVVRMGTVEVTTLHPRGSGSLELPHPLEQVSPLSEDSLRTVCKDGDPLCTIPMNTTSESFPSGEKLMWPKWSMVNSKLPKQMVSPGASPTLIRLLPLATMVSFYE
jgi:hypothetical protein